MKVTLAMLCRSHRFGVDDLKADRSSRTGSELAADFGLLGLKLELPLDRPLVPSEQRHQPGCFSGSLNCGRCSRKGGHPAGNVNRVRRSAAEKANY